MDEVSTKACGPDDASSMTAQHPPLVAVPRVTTDYTVQQAAALTGLSEHNLRYYERIGLLPPPRRDASSGHRRYSEGDLARIETLACLRTVGMSLDQMRHYFALVPNGMVAAHQQQVLLAAHRRVLEERLQQMQRHLDNLQLKIAYWRAVELGDEARVAAIAQEFSARIREDAQRAAAPSDDLER